MVELEWRDTIRRRLLAHPLYTPGVLCIEGVAARLRGELDESETFPIPTTSSSPLTAFSSAGTAPSMPSSSTIQQSENAAYLCCGLDVYLLGEPDIQTAMAFVHSRVRRIFFLSSGDDDRQGALTGALTGPPHLHTLRSLNHHYRVWKMVRKKKEV
jgi:hypothetical protein